jgi:lipid-A-disaccharide synthase
MKSCLIIAGEKSGEEHAMSFFPELTRLCPDVQFYGVGGDELKTHGMELLYHLKDFSSMGFSEVIHKIPFYLNAIKTLEQETVRRKTKTVILIDFQDFNMRLAEKLKNRGIKVLYYVAPQAWAWKPHRAKALARDTHTLFTILPFEKTWFSEHGVRHIRSIPHPLMLTYKNELHFMPERPFHSLRSGLKLLLLPGSRRFEVYNLLPEFMRTVQILRQTMNVEVHLVRVDHINEGFYRLYENQVDCWYPSQDLSIAMKTCHMAIAASGTVTLSTGLFELPTVVCYQGSLLNEFIFYNFIKYKGPISLTNIIHNKMVFPEFTQAGVDPHRLARVIKTWTKDELLYNELKVTLKNTKHLLGGESFSVPEYMARIIHD